MAYGNAQRMWNLQEYIKEYDKLKTSHTKLLEQLTEIQETALRASVVQDRSVRLIKDTCKYIAETAKQEIQEAEKL